MSLPPATRDHLTLSYYNPNWGQWENTRTLEAGEFDQIARAEGYVKLGGIDVGALRDVQFHTEKQIDPTIPNRPAVLVGPGAEVVHDLIVRVLAALEGEDTCPRCGEIASCHIYEHATRSTFCSDGRITPGEFWRQVQRAALEGEDTP